MNQVFRRLSRCMRLVALFGIFTITGAGPAGAASAAAIPDKGESIDALYERAKKEGGQLTLYIALSARSEEIILPIFKKRFPAIQINHIDATSDKLVARAAGFTSCWFLMLAHK